MGRTMIAAMTMLTLAGCAKTDWREGVETVEACMKRHAPKEGAADPLADDPGVWVPAYTYDITRMEDQPALIKQLADGGGRITLVASSDGSNNTRAARKAIDAFEDTPPTEAGAVVVTDDPVLYKVRRKPGLYRDLVRQGCEGQRAGMRLVRFSFYREDALVDGELPRTEMSTAQMREIIENTRPFQIEDLLP